MKLWSAALALLVLPAALAAQPSAPPKFGLQPLGFIWQHLYEGPFAGPSGVFFDPVAGELWVADTANELVGAFTPEGTALFSFGASDEVREPVRVVRFGNRLLVLDSDKAHVKAFNYRGEFLGPLVLPGVGEKPVIGTIATDAEGNLYVGENQSGQVLVYTPDLKLRTRFGSNGSEEGQFQAIAGIAATRDEIYVTDQQVTPVQVFDRRGNFLRGWGKHELGVENFSMPGGVALDSKGRVIVVDGLRHEIKFFDADGKYLSRFGGLGRGLGDVAYPFDVAVDGSDHLYVAEKGNARVQVFVEIAAPSGDDNGAGQNGNSNAASGKDGQNGQSKEGKEVPRNTNSEGPNPGVIKGLLQQPLGGMK